MPPCAPESSSTQSTNVNTAVIKDTLKPKRKTKLDLVSLRKAIPKEAFQKSLLTSCFYMIFDVTIWLSSIYFMSQLTHSTLWTNELSFISKALISLVYWNISGFFMWCIFVVGHDCGHGTFSDYETVNDILGHALHGAILVPFYSWQLSHRRHHMYHNHLVKDYSFPWYTEERLSRPGEQTAQWVLQNKWGLLWMYPWIGWPMYLLGGRPDGCHFYPFVHQRMWRECLYGVSNSNDCRVTDKIGKSDSSSSNNNGNHNIKSSGSNGNIESLKNDEASDDTTTDNTSTKTATAVVSHEEFSKCLISTSVVVFYVLLIASYNQYSLTNFLFYYFASYCIMGWWLVTVTFLQHHSPKTVAYDDSNWSFVKAAFETVDRKYDMLNGWLPIDFLHHHITDGHVAHHLFFTKIPHYNLPLATTAIQTYLKQHGLYDKLYRCEDTSDFMIRIYVYVYCYVFASPEQCKEEDDEEEEVVDISDQDSGSTTAAANDDDSDIASKNLKVDTSTQVI